MGPIKKLLSIKLGILTAVFSSKSLAKFESEFKSDSNNLNYDEFVDLENCEQLLKLEDQSQLTLNEEMVGKVVYDILLQVSESPIDYCDEIKMTQVIEKDPEIQQR